MSTQNALQLMQAQNRKIYVDKYTAELNISAFADIYLQRIGHMVAIPTQFYTNIAPRKDFCLQFTLRGKGDYFVNDRLYAIEPNTLWLIPKDAYHYYVPDKDDPYEYFWIHFNGTSVERFLQAIGISEKQPVLYGLENPNIERAFLRLLELTKTQSSPYLLLSATHELLSELVIACSPLRTMQENSQSQAIDDAVAYVKAHFQEEIYLQDLARVAKLEKVYFTKKFKAETGLSPIQFLIQFRLSVACRLLSTDLPLQEVATACGFQDFTNFLHRFKSFVGMTPTQYKKTLG